MPNTSIDSRLMSFGELFASNYYYSIPDFQRDYSWTEEEVDVLWCDIIATIDEKRNDYFMGAIVVNNSKKPELMLIDGQQRLTTISILMCAVRDIAKEKRDEKRSEQISQNYIVGSLNLRTLTREPKLILNSRDNQFYQEYIVAEKVNDYLIKLPKKNKFTHKSHKLIFDTYLFLYEKIQERISEKKRFCRGRT